MHIIATFRLGDHNLSLIEDAAAEQPFVLTCTDEFPGGPVYVKRYEGENDAVRAFCAIICSDEPDLSATLTALGQDESIKRFLA